MTSPEDYAKDDPIIWDVSKKSLDKGIILDKTTKADDYIYDYMSTPGDSDYSYLFERYIDSFSPAGNIFHTKKYAQADKAKKLAQKETKEMDWEEQFRGGQGMHGYNRGGISMDDYKPQKAFGGIVTDEKGVDESRRMIKLRNMSDVEAMARMMHAESSSVVGATLEMHRQLDM